MIRVMFDLSGKNPPEVIKAFNSPDDKTLDDLAQVIVDTIDINAVLGRKNSNPTVERER